MDLMRSLRHFLSNSLRLGGRDHSQYLITPNGEPGAAGATAGANGNVHHHRGANGTSSSPSGSNEQWKPAEIGPVKRDELVRAYLERHKDSDYGFQVISSDEISHV